MSDGTMFGVKNARVQVIRCGCGGRDWGAALLYGETPDKDKLVLLCSACRRNWVEVDEPDINLLPGDDSPEDIELGGLVPGGKR